MIGVLATDVTDNAVLDDYTIPFGPWTDEAVDWVKLNLQWLLDIIGWPFEFLINNLVEDFLVELPWMWLVGAMFLLAWLIRNLTVAVGTVAGLTVCGLLGNEYWEETARTIGLILVAVLLCVVIGIPLGILAGRKDAFWSTLRPTLDAMQVVHSFVYLLPFIYFWGVGPVGATMATMIFALPPLIRLTNLGIRQVPEDVVEAARAYGASERRVLTDVQLPLARPAIMTGLNQTLLLAFSMLGVAAIMGAGGLGRLLFSALGRQDVALAASAGLAFFILAVVMDRIAQTDAGGSGLFARISRAWATRSNPEDLLGDPDFDPAAGDQADGPDADASLHLGVPAPVGGAERGAMALAAVGAVVGLVSVVLPWTVDGSLLSAYSRRADEDLVGASFSGLAAEGGSWFGYVAVVAALVVLAAVLASWFRLGGGRWLAPDGAAAAALALLLTGLGFALADPSPYATAFGLGIGVWVSLIGGLVAVAGTIRWVQVAPFGPRRPLLDRVLPTPLALAATGVLLSVIALFSAWSVDERADAIISPELQAEIDEIKELEAAGELDPAVAASDILVLRARAEVADRIVIDGRSDAGAGLGVWTLLFTVAGAAAAAVAAGVAGRSDGRQWLGGSVAMGLGAGVAAIAVGWIGSLARATDPNFFSGVGSFIALLAGGAIVAAGSSVISGFERSQLFGAATTAAPIEAPSGEAEGRATVPSSNDLVGTERPS